MDKNIPKTGQKIIIIEKMKNGSKKEYLSQVLERIDDDNYSVAVPISKGLLISMLNGTNITVLYPLENIGVIHFPAKVISKKKMENIPVMHIMRVGEIVKNQRRNYFRMPIAVDLKINRKSRELLRAHSRDLSGGGMRLLSDMDLIEDELFDMSFSLGGREFFLKAKVVRSFGVRESRKYEIAVEFVDISEMDRNDIISYLFHKQRLMIKKR